MSFAKNQRTKPFDALGEICLLLANGLTSWLPVTETHYHMCLTSCTLLLPASYSLISSVFLPMLYFI